MRSIVFASCAFALSVFGLVACSSSTGGAGGAGGGATSTTTASTTSTTTSTMTTTSGTASTGSMTGSTGANMAGDTWANFAQTAFSTYCVECHNPSDPARDYNKLADVQTDAALIRCGVASTMQSGCGASPAPKQFPIDDMAGTNPKPSDVTRGRIVAWIDAGLP